MKLINKIICSVIFVLFLTGLCLNAQQQTPNPVRVFDINRLKGDRIYLLWMIDNGGPSTTGYKLYCSFPGNTEDFKLISKFDYNPQADSGYSAGDAYITTDEGNTWMNVGLFNYYTPYSPRPNQLGTYDTLVTNFPYPIRTPGTYTFMLYSYNEFGNAIQTFRRTIEIDSVPNPSTISFTSTPNPKAYLNDQYTYQVTTVGPAGSTIKYKLLNSPQGMTIDETSGLLMWTPTAKGVYPVEVLAYINIADSMHSATQFYYLHVSGCKYPGVVSGEIYTKSGLPVDFAMAYVYRKLSIPPDSMQLELVTTARVAFGQYYIPLDEGDYYIDFDINNNRNVWYKNANSILDAEAITVICHDTTKLDRMIIADYVKPEYHQISGLVTSSNDGRPIPFVHVEFIGTNLQNGTRDYFITTSNQNGMYGISLSNEYSYIARAFAFDSSNTPGWIPQYYNQVTDPTLATIILADSEKVDVNFVLTQSPIYQNSISGVVIDSTNSFIRGAYLVAYMVESSQNLGEDLYPIRSVITGQDGAFNISNLLPGSYVLLCVPPMRNYVSGYYKESDYAVVNWHNATRFTVTETSNAGPVGLKLQYRYKKQGLIAVKGTISITNGTLKSNDHSLASKTVAGAGVYLFDENNKVADYTFTDDKGNYTISNLAKGKYKLVADRVKYGEYTTTLDLATDDDVINNFGLEKEITSVQEDAIIGEINLYPNPSVDYINITLSELQENTKYSIYNSKGAVQEIGEFQAGNNFQRINLKKLQSGSYYISFNYKGYNLSVPLSVVK